jgi:hypothetical protein
MTGHSSSALTAIPFRLLGAAAWTAAFNWARWSGARAGGTTRLLKGEARWASLVKLVSHWPMVWGSRSSASATWAADQPRANSQRACQRSRSRGLGARYISSRTPRSSKCHCWKSAVISFIDRPRQVVVSQIAYHTDAAGFILVLV